MIDFILKYLWWIIAAITTVVTLLLVVLKSLCWYARAEASEGRKFYRKFRKPLWLRKRLRNIYYEENPYEKPRKHYHQPKYLTPYQGNQ